MTFSFKTLFPHLSNFSLYSATSSEVFAFPLELKHELVEASTSITDKLFSEVVLRSAQHNIAQTDNVLDHFEFNTLPDPYFMTIDLAYAPGHGTSFKLIEAQAFPSISHMFFEYYSKLLSMGKDVFLNRDAYSNLLETINKHRSVLLEDKPWKQRTAIDFHILQNQATIDVLNFRDIHKKDCLVDKFIYNRLIFADLHRVEFERAKLIYSGLPDNAWLHHPDWFYFVSKASLPYIESKWVPNSFLVSKKPLNFFPKENEWVLKPLFEYGCQGVNLNPSKEEVDAVENPSQWLLQQKINLHPLPGTDLFGEIRVVLFKQKGCWVPVMFFARVNDKPFLGSQHFNLNNPQCGAAAIEFVK